MQPPPSTFDAIANDIHRFFQDRDLVARYTRFQSRVATPGPVIAIVGAKNRGKSTLFRLLGDRASSLPAPWVAIPGGAETRVIQLANQPVQLIDFPADAVKSEDGSYRQLLTEVDLVLMVIQATAPAGQQELTFAKEHLSDLPAVLIVNKLDQCDEDDREDALRAIQHWYGSMPWMHILLVGRELHFTPETATSSLDYWWRETASEDLRRSRMLQNHRAFQAWVTAVRLQLHEHLKRLETELSRLEADHSASVFLSDIRVGSESLQEQLRRLPERVRHYAQDQRLPLRRALGDFLDGISQDDLLRVDPLAWEAALRARCDTWHESLRAHVVSRLSADMRLLAPQYDKLKSLVQKVVPSQDTQLARTSTEALASFSKPQSRPEAQMNLASVIEGHPSNAWISLLSSAGSAMLVRNLLAGIIGGPLALFLALPLGLGVFEMHHSSSRAQRASRMRAELQRVTMRIEQDVYETSLVALEDEARRSTQQLIAAVRLLRDQAEIELASTSLSKQAAHRIPPIRVQKSHAERLNQELAFLEDLYLANA